MNFGENGTPQLLKEVLGEKMYDILKVMNPWKLAALGQTFCKTKDGLRRLFPSVCDFYMNDDFV